MFKTTLTALILCAAPVLSYAGCKGADHSQTAMISCAEGTTLNAETGLCVAMPTG